jgi:HEAT repeat protein
MMRKIILSAVTFAVACAWSMAGFAQATEGVAKEADLVAILQSDASFEQKFEACRGLRVVGTAKCVPALAALLNDPQLAPAARFALEPMSLPQAGEALRSALKTTTGAQKTGVIASLGARRDAKAGRALAALLDDSDPSIADAAAGALGRIATPQAVKALQRAGRDAGAARRNALGEALLAAAEHLTAQGAGRRAAAICEDLLAGNWPAQVQSGAFVARAKAQPEKAPDHLLAALAGENAFYRDLAAQVVADMSNATPRYADALATLPTDGQIALLRGLAGRKDAAARPAVLALVSHEDGAVRSAAIRALATLGAAEDAAILLKRAAGDEKSDADAARFTLANLNAPGLDDALAQAAAGNDPEVRALAIDLLADRLAPQGVPTAMGALKDESVQVRLAALSAIGKLGTQSEAAALIDVMKRSRDASERKAAADALSAICAVQRDELLPLVREAMADADTATQTALLNALLRIGSPAALEAVLAARTNRDSKIREEALRVIINWPTLDAAPQLLELARKDAARRQDALRGYVRLAQAAKPVEKTMEMLNSAMKLAAQKEEKWIVLAAWGKVHTGQSIDTLLPLLKDPAVRNEAAAALISVAEGVSRHSPEARVRAREVLRAVMGSGAAQGIRDRAHAALETMN